MRKESVWIYVAGFRLFGELYIPNVVPAPALVICPGLNSQGFHSLKIYTHLAKEACKNGLVALLFDFRGVGKSEGEFDYGFGERQDIKSALTFLATRPDVFSDKIFVVGHSLGGAVSIYAIQNETRIKGLVLWSTPKNHDYNIKKFISNTKGKFGFHLFQLFTLLDKNVDTSKLFKLEVYGVKLRLRYVKEKLMKLNECEAVAKWDCTPLLIVIGDMDEIVSVNEARAIFAAAHNPKSIHVVASGNHIFNGKEEELIKTTIKWIKKWNGIDSPIYLASKGPNS